MANQRSTFAKRNREMKLKDKQRDKAERLASQRSENRQSKGPQIDWGQPGGVGSIDQSEPPRPAEDASPSETAPSPTNSSAPGGPPPGGAPASRGAPPRRNG